MLTQNNNDIEASDSELIDRWKHGYDKAFDIFYKRHSRKTFFYILSITGRIEIAEELLQETFVKLLRNVDRLKKCDNLGPYIATSARNLSIDRLRKTRTEKKAMDVLKNSCMFRNNDTGNVTLCAEEATELLWKLSAVQRETVVLKIYSGFTFAEISSIMNVPLNTAVSRYRYGISSLKSFLNGALS